MASQPKDPYAPGEALSSLNSAYTQPPRNPTNQNGATAPQPIRNYGWNDTGNGQRLLDDGGRESLIYIPKRTFPWHMWDGNCWPADKEQRVSKWMEDILYRAFVASWNSNAPRAVQTDEAKFLNRSNDTGAINAALAAASRSVSKSPDVFDTHDWYLPCNNGRTYDMETGEVIESLPQHYMSRCVDVAALDGPQPTPKWDTALNLVMHDDAAMVQYLRRMLGLCCTGYVGEKSFWFWQGRTDAGKTTILTFIARLLGPFVYSIPLRALLKRRQDPSILHDIAGVRSMRLVYAEEFKPGDVLDSSWVKKVSGGGDITADLKNQPNETFRSTAKLIIGTNDLPAITDVDDAIRGRVRVVPFLTNIPQALDKADIAKRSVEEVVDDLMTEAPAILYNLVQAVAEWRAAGKQLGMPDPIKQSSKHYVDAQDPMLAWISTCCEPIENGQQPTEEQAATLLYWSFRQQSGMTKTEMSPKRFGPLLLSHGFTKRDSSAGAMYTGPKLTADALKEGWKGWASAGEDQHSDQPE